VLLVYQQSTVNLNGNYENMVDCFLTKLLHYVVDILKFSLFLGRFPKVDLIILEGEKMSVRPYVRPSVHKKFLRFE